ncbi:exodeoxyribonuclease V subunit beta [Erysipelothrix urinaevulpis]|uniref:UvrD-helicase domain-containing protein n=1 Tax=Erysipelothrix urinaevulpis TaxID=2683717 RepID=UPI00135B48A6|nr:UvrD-helicase domain-containing protein [Erysipelothrix urinaevulpis]
MATFNPQQQQAINELGKNIIVSASAGAGKTTVLIARLMKRILNDHVHIQQICAMTFTEAAAQEMKTRLLKELHDTFKTQPSEFLEEQIALVETAEITTIHSYCLSLIKNYGYTLGINPSRTENILDEAQVNLLKDEAFKNILNQWLKHQYDLTYNLVEYFSSNPLDVNSFKKSINESGLWLRSKKDPKHAIQDLNSVYTAQSFEQWPPHFQTMFFIRYEELLSQSLFHLNNIIEVVDREAKETTVAAKNNPILRVKSDLMTQALMKCKQKDISFYKDLPLIFDFKLPAVRGSEDFKEAKTPLESLIKQSLSNYISLEKHFELMNDSAPLVNSFIQFTVEYLDEYQRLKEADNSLDFDDFEHFALDILKANNYAVARQLQNHYQEIMVDEFQDTNEIQDEIIRLISNGYNLFRVGDIKQSIYRFRGAKPQIMKNLMEDDDHQNLYLSYNYRSKEDIVMFNNDVFDRLMNLSNNSKYSEHDHVICGLDSQKEGGFPVELHLFELGDEEYELNKNDQRARHIANEIIRHYNDGYSFNDMTVLIRGHAQKTYLKRAFEEANIPHYISERIGFFNSEIVDAVLNLLRYSVSYNDYYLAKALRSPFFNLSENDLAIIKLTSNQSFNENLRLTHPKLYQEIHDMVQTWKFKDIISILQEIYQLNNAYIQVLSIQDKTNLDFLLDKAIQFQKNSVPNIQGFLMFVEALEDDQSSEASHLSNDDDVVRVMTVHQSKGLQFPIVFFWSGGRLTVMDHMSPIVFDDLFGLGINHLDMPLRIRKKTLIRELIEYKQTHEELEEMLRLLYVALTRPQNKLIVLDVVKEVQSQPLNRHLLLNYQRQIQLLLAAASPQYSQIIVRDASEINFESLDDVKLEKRQLFFDNLELTVPTMFSSDPFGGLDLNPESKWAMNYGTTLHEAIESLPHTLWHKHQLFSFDRSIQQRLLAYNNHPFTQKLYSFITIEHELPFLIREDNEIVNGIIDFTAINPDEIIIVDFKSDNVTADVLIERYKDQIKRYKNALDKVYPKRSIKCYIYSFNLGDYVHVSL